VLTIRDWTAKKAVVDEQSKKGYGTVLCTLCCHLC
jgi:hypothetical protein